MNIGWAIERMKEGHPVCRPGWNGKGMFVFLREEDVEGLAHLVMRTAQGAYQPGWLASQADLLAEDWELAKP